MIECQQYNYDQSFLIILKKCVSFGVESMSTFEPVVMTDLKSEVRNLKEKDLAVMCSVSSLANCTKEISSVSPRLTKTIEQFNESISECRPESIVSHNDTELSQHGLL